MVVLVVDDEPSMQRVLRDVLEREGYEVRVAASGGSALKMCDPEPDLIVLDVMLPDIDGFEACSRMRGVGVTAPVIFLTARGDIIDKGIGFRSGGDDYMVKPFDTRELLMHVRAHLRRRAMDAAPKRLARFGEVEVDFSKMAVSKRGEPVDLTPTEYRIVAELARRGGDVASKADLVESAWGKDFLGETTSLTVFVRKIREKLEDDPSNPRYLLTVWGIGYRMGD